MGETVGGGCRLNVCEKDINDIRPYENNPRDNFESIARVAESIKEFGFLQPIVCDQDGVIIAGHTRLLAAASLGIKKVPVVYASNLSPAQVKAYRLADNKVGESSKWLDDALFEELEAIELEAPDIDMGLLGFEVDEEHRRQASWKHVAKLCDLKKRKITISEHNGHMFTTFFTSGKTGRSLEEIKEDPSLVPMFADNLCDYVLKTIGGNLEGNGWCLCTTPRRRHLEGFHFATEICREASTRLGIPFYAEAIISGNRRRVETNFVLARNPAEHNVILSDDIMTTGITIRDSRELLIEKGHSVFAVIAIKNQGGAA